MGESANGTIRLKDRPPEMRPRERLMEGSPQNLSTSELLAILLGTGTSEHGVTELADIVLIESGGLEGLLRQSMASFCAIKGIGPSKACTLLAAIELGRRLALANVQRASRRVSDTESAAWLLRANLRTEEQESFHVLYLDARHQLIETKELFVGTVNGANVHPRDIFREAVRLNAVALIIGHNHPSGDLTPSGEDLLMTKRVREGAALLGLSFLDHIIIAGLNDEAYFSFKDAGFLE